MFSPKKKIHVYQNWSFGTVFKLVWGNQTKVIPTTNQNKS